MAVPEPITNHTEIALGRLVEQFKKDKPVLHGLIRAFVDSLQDLEDNVWQVIWGRMLDYPPVNNVWRAEGNQLDTLGKIVGAKSRLGLEDLDFRELIRLQIRINRSYGRPNDLLEIFRMAVGDTAVFTYREYTYNAMYFYMESMEVPVAVIALNALNRGRAAGCRAILEYFTDRVAEPDMFRFSDGGTGGAGGYGNQGDSTSGGLLTSMQG
jgi:hypothetical protein